MLYTYGKVASYLLSGIFIILALVHIVREGIDIIGTFYAVGAFLSYEFADYLVWVKEKTARNLRNRQPCLICRTTGKIGGKRCKLCGGKGWVIAPYDRDRPPIT